MIERAAVASILLAAGRSTRFGDADKLLTRIGGVPLAMLAAKAIVDLRPARRIAVCADDDGALAMMLHAEGFEIVVNARPDAGLSESLRLGIDAVTRGRESAALLSLADMPFVRTSHLEALLQRFDTEAAPIVASSRGGQPMPPALFGRPAFGALKEARGDEGGRALLASAALVPAPADQLADIDRPEDLSSG
jgi:molybdenum cofactor cytidylyltransferase